MKCKLTKEKLRTLYHDQNKSAPDIAGEFGFNSASSIYYRINKWNIKEKSEKKKHQSRLEKLYKRKIEEAGLVLNEFKSLCEDYKVTKTDISNKIDVKDSTVKSIIDFFDIDFVLKKDLIDTEEIIHLHKNFGWSCPKIGKYYNISSGAVYKRMKRAGVEVERPLDFFTEENLTWLYHEKNKSAKQIADLHGVSERGILLKLREFDIQIDERKDYDYSNCGVETHTEEAKRKMRKSYIAELKEKHGETIAPNYNPEACELIEEYGDEHGYDFQHAENGGEYHIKELGYWVDGYDPKENVVIEVDEPHHFNENGNLCEKDKRRQREIQEHLDCKFVRLTIDSKFCGPQPEQK